MPNLPLENEHMDVLQNIEFAIHSVYLETPEVTDYQVDSALETLGKTYQGEAMGRPPSLPRNPLSVKVYEAMRAICEIRLGRAPIPQEFKKTAGRMIEPVSIEVIMKCLKRIRKSVDLWTKQGGSQGYLNYISQFLG